jgi:3-oxoacyl-[acyl-carrier-protein] synthase II
MKACILGAGVVGGFGCGLGALEAAIRNRSAAEAPAVTALTARTDLLDRFVPPRTLRRVDHYARMALLASRLALEDAGMDDGLPENTGLIVATGMGPTANTLDLQPADVAATDLALSPILFSNSVQNAAAAYISMLLKIRGPCLSINQYEMSVPLAFQTAIDWLEEGRASTVLVGGVDCFSKALHDADLAWRESGNAGHIPGATLVGEGSAFFILTRSEAAGAQCPFVHQVHMETASRSDGPPVPNTLILHNSWKTDLLDHAPAHVTFAHLYGTFPTSMGMDVAAALALLRTEQLLSMCLPQSNGGSMLPENPRIGCLKQGETGDWGMIVIGRDGR